MGVIAGSSSSSVAAPPRAGESTAPAELQWREPATTQIKCLTKGMISYCIPNTFKYQVCQPTVKVFECPINSYCRETKDTKGNNFAYCKFIG